MQAQMNDKISSLNRLKKKKKNGRATGVSESREGCAVSVCVLVRFTNPVNKMLSNIAFF